MSVFLRTADGRVMQKAVKDDLAKVAAAGRNQYCTEESDKRISDLIAGMDRHDLSVTIEAVKKRVQQLGN